MGPASSGTLAKIEATVGWPRTATLAILLVCTVALALPTLDNGFSLDDYNWLERAAFRDSTLGFVVEPEPGQVFSPIGRGFFLLLFSLAAANPLPYRLAVLALHVLNVVLLTLVVDRVFLERSLRAPRASLAQLPPLAPVATVSAFLFVVATSYDEALFWVAALFHPLNASLCLAALLGLLSYLQGGARSHLRASVLAYAAALLTKAPAFPFFVVLTAAVALVETGKNPRDGSRWRPLAPFAVLFAAAAGLNLALGLQHSYLLERSYYRVGSHLATNAAHYLGWMALPWEAAAERLGTTAVYQMARAVLEVLLPIGVAVLLVRGSARVRFFVAFGLVALLPFLPFVFAPVSRYTYLATLGLAPVAAVGALALGRLLKRPAWDARLRTAIVVVPFGALAMLSLADTMVRDNRYEHRERQMIAWVEDVERALPELPTPPVVWIENLPTLGIDRGIHLEAALRLAYGDDALRLKVGTPEAPEERENALAYDDGRISPAR